MNIFKKITTGVLALTIGMCVIPSAVSASMNESYRKGDIDGDGDVDNVDSAYLANFLSGIKGSANDQMSQRLDVDLSGIIDKHDKTILSSMIANGSGPIYYNYETSNLGIPSQSTIEYRKYNAQTGAKIGNNYTLSPVSNISTNSVSEPELTRGTDYSNKGIVGVNATINGVTYSGTGFVVGTNKVLTAAHCVYDTDNNYSSHYVSVDVYENTDYTPNNYSANSYHIPQDYYELSAYSATWDYAVITVNHNFPSSYIMDLGVARNKLKNNTPSTIYNNINDNNGISRLCLYLTGRWMQMWTEEGYFKYINGMIMNDNVFYCTHMGNGGQSGSPVYVETEDEDKTVFGIESGGSNDHEVCKRITTDILHFVLNNSNF